MKCQGQLCVYLSQRFINETVEQKIVCLASPSASCVSSAVKKVPLNDQKQNENSLTSQVLILNEDDCQGDRPDEGDSKHL
jgi:hypothetical protein